MTEISGRPFIVGVGGTLRPGSTSERALRFSLATAETFGATTCLLGAEAIDLPLYREGIRRDPGALRFIEALRRADGVVVASPGYHGSISGLVKNALDYVEDLHNDERPYLDGLAFGCIASASGWQAAAGTLAQLRNIAHALRAWPTPMGVLINSAASGLPGDDPVTRAAEQLELMTKQVVSFVRSPKPPVPGRDSSHDPASSVQSDTFQSRITETNRGRPAG